MPIFEYRCQDCDKVAEYLEGRSAKGVHACPACGSKRTRRIFSTFAPQSGSQGDRPSGKGCFPQCGQGRCPAGE
ncbi:MAG: hypothetical protein MOGMAGMI_01580 [Candidatus Omnitrophica bacterium]|nr:hypothetical protein [Candidatus Omnitrophota bacterium]